MTGYTVAPGGLVDSAFTHVPETSIVPEWQLLDSLGNVIVAINSGDLTEVLPGSGIWALEFNAPVTLGDYIIIWSVVIDSTEYSDTDEFTVALPVVNEVGLGGGARMPLWLEFCGREVSNAARMISYIENGLRPQGIDAPSPSSGLPSILYRIPGTLQTFSDPVSDPAPWYTSAIPESADLLGVIFDPRQCTEIEARPVRTVTQRVNGLGGGTIGPRSYAPLELTLKGYIIAMSDCGAEYGERWLTSVLNPDDPCQLCQSQIRTCSPPDDGSDDQRGLWLLYDVAVTDGPHFGRDVAADCHHIISVEFTLMCEKPYLYKPPRQCIPATIINPF